MEPAPPNAIDFATMLLPLVLLLSVYIPFVMYILSFRKTAEIVNLAGGNAPVNAAWLLLLPLLGIPLFFVLLIQLKAAIVKTGRNVVDSQWWTYGLIAGVIQVSGFFVAFAPTQTVVTIVAGAMTVFWFVFAILHWMKIVELRTYFK